MGDTSQGPGARRVPAPPRGVALGPGHTHDWLLQGAWYRMHWVASCQAWPAGAWARASLLRLASLARRRPPDHHEPTDPLAEGGAGDMRRRGERAPGCCGLCTCPGAAGGNGVGVGAGSIPAPPRLPAPLRGGCRDPGLEGWSGLRAEVPAGCAGPRGSQVAAGCTGRAPWSSAQVGAGERARDCRGIRGCARGAPGDHPGVHLWNASLAARGCTRWVPRWLRRDAGRAPLPLPPSSPPHTPPRRGSGPIPGRRRRRGPLPSATPPPKHLWCRGSRGCRTVLRCGE